MPEMNGMEMLKKIEDEHGKETIPVVAVTASVFKHQRLSFLESGFADFIDKPVRAEAIYACLAAHLDVTYETSEAAAGVEENLSDPSQWADLRLPEELLNQLRTAITHSSITELRGLLTTLESQEGGGHALASHLRVLASQFDMPAVQEVIDALPQA